MRTLIIDNYDSFTFNLFQYVGELGGNPLVKRNDEIDLAEIEKLNPTHIIISPGPGRPDDPEYFGVNRDVILKLSSRIPTLGVCLGHQGICFVLGGKVIRAPEIMHGKTSAICHDGRGIFRGVKNPLIGMRYHSLIAEKKSIPRELKITATEKESVAPKRGAKSSEARSKRAKEDGIVMAVAHRKFPLFGIQFHPESIGTPEGKKILKNFLAIKKS